MTDDVLDVRFAEICAKEGPLGERLRAFDRTLHDLDLPSAKAYENLVTTLQAAGTAGTAPLAGDQLPGFLLPDHAGRLVSLESLLQRGRLVVSFNRGHWCQFCQLELAAFTRAHQEFAKKGATVVSILPERLEYLRQIHERSGGTIIALSDMDNSYALELGLAVWLGDDVIAIYKSINWDLSKYQGNNMWFVPVPATFVVAQDGRIIARYVDPDFRTRMEIDQILAALDEP